MSGAPDPIGGLERRLIEVTGGHVRLRDERKKAWWTEVVGAFAIDPFPVTRGLWRAVAGEAAVGGDDDLPVTDVSWLDAVRFCNQLSEQAGRRPCYRGGDDPDGRDVAWDRAADGWRLPTEAEWERACRAGSAEARYGPLDAIAWYAGNSGGRIHPVGTKAPNAWGLHDTLGNAWEWCWDVYDPEVYGPYRVFRGGGWADEPRACRASCRRRSHPTFRIDDLGFRLVRSLNR